MTQKQYISRQTELSANMVAFCRYLRAHGFGISPAEEADALLALSFLEAYQDRESFRLGLQAALVKNVRQQQLFNELYQEYWQNLEKAVDSKTKEIPQQNKKPKGNAIQKQPSLQTLKSWLFHEQSDEEIPIATYSAQEVITEKDFSTFREDELREIKDLIRKLAQNLTNRYKRLYQKSHSHKLLDLKKTIRNSMAQGGEITQLFYREKQLRKFKLIMLCDVSKSMDLYTQFLIQFMYAFQTNYQQLETFVFSTSLHCITEALKERDFDEVLEKLSHTVPHWSGGTRIGGCLQYFVANYADKLLSQRSIILILSDGWDTGDTNILAENMQYIYKKSAKVIWLNPLAGHPQYQPSANGMQAALPFIDVFASAHNLNSLKKVLPHLRRRQAKKIDATLSNMKDQ